ncbi:hypothetical protein BT69DRAFT_1275643 [Atractiella rhizophila]|nr:hypothetical protein BT69DRAFT_1275643 [Atractiella rhizophila]
MTAMAVVGKPCPPPPPFWGHRFPPLLVEGSFLRTLLFYHQCHVEHTVFDKEMIAKTKREAKLEGSYNRKI